MRTGGGPSGPLPSRPQEVRVVSARVRFVAVLAGAAVAAGAFGVPGSFAASIVLSLTADHNLELRLDNGARIRPGTAGAVIAPGTYAAVVIFHVATGLLFPIGVFPLVMIVLTTVFFAHDWPRRAPAVLPPTAIGKDFPYDGEWFGRTPSGTGLRATLGGYLGITVGWLEGFELNVFGAVLGIDIRRPAIKIPGIGRIGMSAVPA